MARLSLGLAALLAAALSSRRSGSYQHVTTARCDAKATMARLSLGLAALLVAALPAMTWSSALDMEEEEEVLLRSRSEQLKQAHHEDEDNTVIRRTVAREDSSANGQAGARGLVLSSRGYLNALVESSVANKDNQEGNIAFVKTHKTGSTSMAAILYRYAVRHGLKLARFGKSTSIDLRSLAGKVERMQQQPVDIMHYHISPNGHFNGKWSDACRHYRRVMRYPDSVNFITVMREPRSHFLSYYYYYLQPANKLSLEEFLTTQPSDLNRFKLLRNPLAAEFGANTLKQTEHLLSHALPSFKLVFLTERFDEGLMVLRRILGWKMIDMTYMKLNQTKAGLRRFDGKPLLDAPAFDDLPEKVRNKIDALTELDQLLYTTAKQEYAKRLEPMSSVIASDLEEFQELQDAVREYLKTNSSSEANAMYRAMNVYNRAPPLHPF